MAGATQTAGVKSKRRRWIIIAGAGFAFVVAAFALPLAAVVLLGPELTASVVRALDRVAGAEHAHPVGKQVAGFTLVDQLGRKVTRDDLKGRVWVASFFLSRCAGTCPMTSAKMARLQREVADQDVMLVSFSMDGEFDTPEVLRGHAAKFNCDAERWRMLTGDRRQVLAIVDGLGLAAQQGQTSGEMIHSDRFVLVDRDGRARGYYESGDEDAMKHLEKDAAVLARRALDR